MQTSLIPDMNPCLDYTVESKEYLFHFKAVTIYE